MTAVVHHGDCLEVLRGMVDNSVDSIVTDPPYGLSFMGKKWDYDVPAVEVWTECLRVLKPGGHLLAFAGTRTQHRMAVRIEDAGFEIRDMIAWVYGSGFPKSLDVSKAIDKQRTEDVQPVRAVCRAIRAAMDARALKSRDLAKHFGDCHPRLIDHWAARDTDSQPSLPTWEQWQTLREVLGMDETHAAEVWRLNGRKGQTGDTWQAADIVGHHEGSTPGFGEHRFSVRDTAIREASEAARQWQGWGTALKPALEPITVARKPLGGTVAGNVLEWGTGAMNIEGCRVATNGEQPAGSGDRRGGSVYAQDEWTKTMMANGGNVTPEGGRWPANLIHDGSDEVVALFPDKAGASAPVRGTEASAASVGNVTGERARVPGAFHADTGSAARFFYCAKASRDDRNEGTESLEQRLGGMVSNTSGQHITRRDEGYEPKPQGNNHPTVKPTDLMRYLCRLVTPAGGTVLDPFSGSGSTGKAAVLEGFEFVGIEREAAYVQIAQTRIKHAQALRSAQTLDLFGEAA